LLGLGDDVANTWETQNAEENCVSVAAATVAKGTHTVNFRTSATASWTQFAAGTLSVLWVPFDGTGAVPQEITGLDSPDVGSAPGVHGSEGRSLQLLEEYR
jgi:hypothetical protein